MVTKKRKRGKSYQVIIFSLFLTIVVLGVVGFLFFSNWKINKQRLDLNERIENLKEQIKSLEEKKKELEAVAAEIGKESHLEEVAREQLNLKKPGEEVVAVLAPEKEQEGEVKEEKNFWQKILDPVRNFFGDL